MEAATATDFTQASEILGRYITLGIAAKGYVSDLTVQCTSIRLHGDTDKFGMVRHGAGAVQHVRPRLQIEVRGLANGSHGSGQSK